MNLQMDEFPDYYGDAIQTHFDTFKQFDIEATGFISPENLKVILDTLGVEVDMEVVNGMLLEVAILSNHENDGKLSFRDYMKCIEYEKHKDEHNRRAEEALAAAEEAFQMGIGEVETREKAISSVAVTRRSMIERRSTPTPPTPEEVAAQEKAKDEAAEAAEEEQGSPEDEEVELTGKMRGTSFAVMTNLAKSRIAAFQKQKSETELPAPEPATARTSAKMSDEEKQSDVVSKIQKFKRVEADTKSKTGKLALATENIEVATLKNKLAAFEQARKDAENDHHTIKKSWKSAGFQCVHGGSTYKGKSLIRGANGEVGPPPKKNIADLLK